MPSFSYASALGALLAAAALSACTTDTPPKSLAATAIAPAEPASANPQINSEAPGVPLAAEEEAALPETVAVIPYAAGAPTPATMTALAMSAERPAAVAALSPSAMPAAAASQANGGSGLIQPAVLRRDAAVAQASTEPQAEAVPAVLALPDTAPLPRPQPIAFAKTDNPLGGVVLTTKPRSTVETLMEKYAALYEVPVDLVRRVAKRESNFNPRARNRVYWGLMQIRHDTAMGMGYRGPATGLLDPDTNLKYAVKYLRGAYLVAHGDHDRADRLYQRGYYYDAKRMGLLEETGLRPSE